MGAVALVVHGGAWNIPPSHAQTARTGCEAILEQSLAGLTAGGTAMGAVEHAVRLLEDDPRYNAGTGSHPSHRGHVEMDAIIADGATLRFGAVAAIQHVANPVSVARKVMEETQHSMLAGDGATEFAREHDFPYVEAKKLSSGKFGPHAAGTVGAVAIDTHGHVAAATSTGGRQGQLYGRVGDSPLIGCGAIADDEIGAVSATGWGEDLMRVQISRTVLEYMRVSDPMTAAYRAIQTLKRRTGGQGGVICADPAGRIGYAFNTPAMAAAGIDGSERRFAIPDSL